MDYVLDVGTFLTIYGIDDTLYDAFGQRQAANLFTHVSQHHVV